MNEFYVLRCQVFVRRDDGEFLVADCDYGKDSAKNRLRAKVVADALATYEAPGKLPSQLAGIEAAT